MAQRGSLRGESGEIFGLLGPNGAGKTTTLSILEGLLQAGERTVHVLGRDVKTDATQIKQRIGARKLRWEGSDG